MSGRKLGSNFKVFNLNDFHRLLSFQTQYQLDKSGKQCHVSKEI